MGEKSERGQKKKAPEGTDKMLEKKVVKPDVKQTLV